MEEIQDSLGKVTHHLQIQLRFQDFPPDFVVIC